AAQLLRDSIVAPSAVPTPSATGTAAGRPASSNTTTVPRSFGEGGGVSEPASVSDGGNGVSEAGGGLQEAKAPAPEQPSASSADLYAKFAQRAKRRRVDRRLESARTAIDGGRLKAAALALDELVELDPNLPELAALTADFDNLRRTTATPRRGPGFAAAAVFVIGMLAASWLQDSTLLL